MPKTFSSVVGNKMQWARFLQLTAWCVLMASTASMYIKPSETGSQVSNFTGSRNITFPPLHCKQDVDCIGKNASSRVYYDPNGRCDLLRSVCACSDGYKHAQFKVKQRGRRSAPNGTESVLYVAKCVPEANVNLATPLTELNMFLRSLHYYGQNCEEDKQCAVNLICRQLVPSMPRLNQTTINGTLNGSSFAHLLLNRTKRCRCPIGQHWNKHTRRCDWPYSSNFLLHSANAATKAEENKSGSTSSLPTIHISASNIDLKIFEIVLEIAFLLACLIGYKACSNMCCKDESTEASDSCRYSGTSGDDPTGCDTTVKSDEESIISSSAPVIKQIKKNITVKTGSGVKKPVITKNRLSRKRKVSRFCSRSRRSTSPYSLQTASLFSSSNNFRRLSSVSASAMSHSSSASTRNLLVKINQDDVKRLSVSTILAPPSRTTSPCYNCRIYKEVYSPSARCKSCRSSLLSVTTNELNETLATAAANQMANGPAKVSGSLLEFDSLLTGVTSDGMATPCSDTKKSILPLPPYKPQKPIRRSEEVGVPPHLRAPYRDSQPFWLK